MKVIDQHIVRGLSPSQFIIPIFLAVRIRRQFVFSDRKDFYFVQDVSTVYFVNMFLITPEAQFHLFKQFGYRKEAFHPNRVPFRQRANPDSESALFFYVKAAINS